MFNIKVYSKVWPPATEICSYSSAFLTKVLSLLLNAPPKKLNVSASRVFKVLFINNPYSAFYKVLTKYPAQLRGDMLQKTEEAAFKRYPHRRPCLHEPICVPCKRGGTLVYLVCVFVGKYTLGTNKTWLITSTRLDCVCSRVVWLLLWKLEDF